jgi:hypothetical protein
MNQENGARREAAHQPVKFREFNIGQKRPELCHPKAMGAPQTANDRFVSLQVVEQNSAHLEHRQIENFSRPSMVQAECAHGGIGTTVPARFETFDAKGLNIPTLRCSLLFKAKWALCFASDFIGDILKQLSITASGILREAIDHGLIKGNSSGSELTCSRDIASQDVQSEHAHERKSRASGGVELVDRSDYLVINIGN